MDVFHPGDRYAGRVRGGGVFPDRPQIPPHPGVVDIDRQQDSDGDREIDEDVEGKQGIQQGTDARDVF